MQDLEIGQFGCITGPHPSNRGLEFTISTLFSLKRVMFLIRGAVKPRVRYHDSAGSRSSAGWEGLVRAAAL